MKILFYFYLEIFYFADDSKAFFVVKLFNKFFRFITYLLNILSYSSISFYFIYIYINLLLENEHKNDEENVEEDVVEDEKRRKSNINANKHYKHDSNVVITFELSSKRLLYLNWFLQIQILKLYEFLPYLFYFLFFFVFTYGIFSNLLIIYLYHIKDDRECIYKYINTHVYWLPLYELEIPLQYVLYKSAL